MSTKNFSAINFGGNIFDGKTFSDFLPYFGVHFGEIETFCGENNFFSVKQCFLLVMRKRSYSSNIVVGPDRWHPVREARLVCHHRPDFVVNIVLNIRVRPNILLALVSGINIDQRYSGRLVWCSLG